MRTVALLCLLLAPLLGCDSVNVVLPKGPEPLTIDLQYNFEADRVVIELDQQPIYDGEVTTDHLVSLAERLTFTIAEGEHNLRVTVNDRTFATDTFVAGETIFVAVSYSEPERAVNLTFSDEVWNGYD